MAADLTEAEYEVFQLVTFLEWGITPDKINEEPVLYKEDIIDIMEAKKLIAKGDEKLRKREEARNRGRASARKLR